METMSKLSLQYVLNALTLRWRTLIVTSALVFAALVALIFQLKPTYDATAIVLLSPSADQLVDDQRRGAAMTDPFFVRSETAIMSSDAVGRAVIGRLHLEKSDEFQPHGGLISRLGFRHARPATSGVLSPEDAQIDQVLRSYRDRLSIANDGRSNTVQIVFTASDPRLAAVIANTHADIYLEEQLSRRADIQGKSVEWLAKQVDLRASEARDADALIQQLQMKSGIVSANATTVAEQSLAQINGQLTDARRQLSTQKALLSEVHQLRAGGDAGNAASMVADESLKSLLLSRVQKEASVLALEKRLAPNHPSLINERQALASVNKVLNDQLQRLESEASSSATVLQRQVDDLESSLGDASSHKVRQDRAAVALPALLAQAQVKRAVFENVLNRYQTLLAERANLTPAATVVSRAAPTARASFPNVPLFLVVAAMVALLGGIFAAVVTQFWRAPSIGLEAISDAVGIQPLVSVPRFRNISKRGGSVQISDARLFVESLRYLRDAILERRSSVTCLVTSMVPQQGKSLVAMSLARALARTGCRTLYMEMDLRQPSGSALARRVAPPRGVAALLEGRASIAEVTVHESGGTLDLLLAEKDASSALDKLNARTVRELLAQLQHRYEAIIIDSPPVGVVSDALTLASLADQTIVVAKDGDASISDLRRGVRLLKDRGATIAGLVLTSVDPDAMSSVDRKTLNRYVLGIPGTLVAREVVT